MNITSVDRQHVFKEKHICMNFLHNKGQADTFMFDLQKAFDTPFHDFLGNKLLSSGICGKTLKLIDY